MKRVVLFIFTFIILLFAHSVYAIQTWDLNTRANYTVTGTTKIEITNSIASLIDGVFLYPSGNFDTPGFALDVAISPDGNIAYVADNNDGVQVIDISNPAAPTLIGNLNTTTAYRIKISSDGNTLYLADQSGGFLTIDVTNPATPLVMGIFNTLNSVQSIDISSDENIAYLADNSGGLVIVDITNPFFPTLIQAFPSSRVGNVLVDGNRVFLSDVLDGLLIIDVTNPTTPVLIGSFNSVGGIWSVGVSSDGNTAYVGTASGDISILDITNPTTPALLGTFDSDGGIIREIFVSADNNTLYLSDNDLGFSVVDVSTPTTPTLLDILAANSWGITTSPDERIVYMAAGSDGFQIIGIPDLVYAIDSPFVTSSTQVFTSTLSSFTETLGSGNQGTVTYQVSTDNGNVWQYWNGSAWTATTQTDGSETSSASDINTNIVTLDTDGGQFLWRAYLNSDGTQGVELDTVELDGTLLDIVLTNPTTDIDVINQGWFPITTEVTCDSPDDCGDIEFGLELTNDFFFERTETGGEVDCITDNVCIARADLDVGIHNSVTETFFDLFQAPADTQWTENPCGENPETHIYGNWIDVIGGGFNPSASIGVPMCVHLVTDDIYLDIEFQSWNDFGTGFSYSRSSVGTGIIPTTPTQPFYTNELSNPITVSLDAGETYFETFWVYADGTVGDSFDFFTHATPVGLPDFRQESTRHEITIIAPVINNDPTDITLDNNMSTELEPTGSLIGTLSTTDTDATDIHSYSFSCVNADANDSDFQIVGSQLQVKNSLPSGTYGICIVTYDNRGGIVEQNFSILLEEDTSSSSNPSSSNGGSVRFICEDPAASNYNDTGFGRHKQSLCRYDSQTQESIPETALAPTESNPFGGAQCPAQLIITDNLKQGDRDGQYGSYNQGIVTQVHLLQTHMNRLLLDEYGNQASGPVDGIFGPLTKRGVERLQMRLNQLLPNMTPLVIDGIVGPFTKAAINNSCTSTTTQVLVQNSSTSNSKLLEELRRQLSALAS